MSFHLSFGPFLFANILVGRPPTVASSRSSAAVKHVELQETFLSNADVDANVDVADTAAIFHIVIIINC